MNYIQLMFKEFKQWLLFWISNLDPVPMFVIGFVLGYIIGVQLH